MKIVPHTWLKERRMFTQNVFLVQAQTTHILEVNKIFVQFHCLRFYGKLLYQNDQFPVATVREK